MAAEATTGAAVQHAGGGSSEIILFLVLMGIIAAISLYEYFSSIKWQQVTSDTRNSIVFENRNKNYGAYEIRSNYNRNLLLIILGLILFLGLSYGGKMAYDKFSAGSGDEEDENLKQVVVEYYEEPVEEEEIPEPEPEPEPEQVLEDQAAFLPPVVTNDQVDTPPPTVTELDDKKVGKEDVKGNSDWPTDTPPPPTKVEKAEPATIETVVDEMAEFPGGRKALVKFLVENIQYPDIARELGLSGKSVLKFVVGSDGTIKSVTVVRGMKDCKECDNEAVRVVRKMPHWTPAKKQGKVVSSYFILPVEFSLE